MIPEDILKDLNRNKTTVVLNSFQIHNKKLVEEFAKMGYDVVEEKDVPQKEDQ